ncbi:MAG: hypothetical protein EZS28_055458, partial [Streblomastix strix]
MDDEDFGGEFVEDDDFLQSELQMAKFGDVNGEMPWDQSPDISRQTSPNAEKKRKIVNRKSTKSLVPIARKMTKSAQPQNSMISSKSSVYMFQTLKSGKPSMIKWIKNKKQHQQNIDKQQSSYAELEDIDEFNDDNDEDEEEEQKICSVIHVEVRLIPIYPNHFGILP